MDNIYAISTSLEAICVRLARLRIAPDLSPETGRLIEAVLADPGSHHNLLARLVDLSAYNTDLREAFISLARDLGDRLESDSEDGYPAITNSGEDLSDEEHLETEESGPRRDRFGGRHTTIVLAEEDADPEYDSEDAGAEYNGEDSEDELLDEEAGFRLMLEDSQAILEEFEAQDPMLGPSGPMTKRPRLSEDAPFEAVEAELEAIEVVIVEYETAVENIEAAASALAAVLDTVCEIVGAECEDLIRGASPRVEDLEGHDFGAGLEIPRQELAESHRLLSEFEEDVWTVGLEELLAAAGKLRVWLNAATKDDPVLKRKYVDLEALDEIRAEQNSTAPIIGRADFADLVREIGQDYAEDLEFDDGAVDALRAAAEDYLIRLFDGGNLAAIHGNRTFLAPKDIMAARRMRGEHS